MSKALVTAVGTKSVGTAQDVVVALFDANGLFVGYQQGNLAGAANSRPIAGTGKTTKNRYRPSVDESHVGAAEVNNRATWTPAENVTELTITNHGAQSVRVVFDHSAADAPNQLAVVGGVAVDVPYDTIRPGETIVRTGVSYFTSVDFERTAAETALITIGAQ